MKRREFQRRVAGAIAGWGLIDAAWLRYGVDAAAASRRYPYYQVAPPTGRKLALLVGINQYPSTQSLNGCLTDVELQRELLIHRFGFKAADILTLTEQQATRQQIETAFLEHLIGQAQPDDVVVFHFSGYGRRVEKRAEGSEGEKPVAYNSLVAVDGEDLLDETLWLLLRSLSTKHITTILDTSFNAWGKILPGNLLIRSFPQAVQGQISEAELDFQKQIQQNSKFKTSIMPGVILLAAGSTGAATEAKWNGFSAGLFTYALTQYLWETTKATTVQVSLSRTWSVVDRIVGNQQPQPLEQKNQDQFDFVYHLTPEPNISANGVVKLVEEDGKTVQLWLAGILPTVLEYYEVGSKLTLVPLQAGEQGRGGVGERGSKEEILIPYPKSKIQNSLASSPQPPAPPLLQMRSRAGLIAKAQIVGDSNRSVQVGQLVQEAVRVLPRNIRLTIALDPNLERIERVDATSAFAAIPYVSLVTAGEQLIDYVFGRVPETKPPETPTTQLSASSASRYGLFSLAQKLIPNTGGEWGEAVKVAVQRLSPKLQTLLAAKLWRLTTNEGSSLLNVKATLEIAESGGVFRDGETPSGGKLFKTINTPNQVLMQRETQRSQKQEPIWASKQSKKLFSTPVRADFSEIPLIKPAQSNSSLQLSASSQILIPIGSRIQYRVHNDGDRLLYLLLLGLDSSKNAIALFSGKPDPTVNNTNPKPLLIDVAIAPGETLIIPPPAVDFEWVIHKPTGLAEHQLIFSTAKFTTTLAALGIAGQTTEDHQYIGALSNPLEVAQAIMQDLHRACAIAKAQTPTSNTPEAASSPTDTYWLDVNQWASLSFVYQVT